MRDELWHSCKLSLLNQTSKNWKGIVVGDKDDEPLDPNYFVTINYDDFTKKEKLEKAMSFIANESQIKPSYVIRLDDDDVISPSIINEIENLPSHFDCYYDEFQVCIDLVYLKRSLTKTLWMANSVIHRYDHAITKCGIGNIPLILQDHDEYWHFYYKGKNAFAMNPENPIYYRLLTPFSITSSNNKNENKMNWERHLLYLNGYGPWTSLPKNFFLLETIKRFSEKYFKSKPKRTQVYWMFNEIKNLKRKILT